MGHHWEVRSSLGALLARAVRVHIGGKVAVGFSKFRSFLELDAGTDIHAELRGADDTVLARIASPNKQPAQVTVTDPTGIQRVKSVREEDTLTVVGGDDRVLATVVCEGDGPWEVKDGAGVIAGEMIAGTLGPSVSQKLSQWLWDPQLASRKATHAQSMHLGIRPVMQYAFVPATDSMSAGLALLPVLAGYTY